MANNSFSNEGEALKAIAEIALRIIEKGSPQSIADDVELIYAISRYKFDVRTDSESKDADR